MSQLCYICFDRQLKIKKSGDWRKEILGEMTVMNAEEVGKSTGTFVHS